MNCLNEQTVKLIKSGQVVTGPSSAVKELIENALDAGATSIDIKLANYGLDLLEVKDNGSGVAPEDIPTLVKGHYTSKIKDFSDLAKISTYGFRGEALHSLCSVSSLEILSKRKSDQLAKRIQFDTKNQVCKESATASNVGTTIRAMQLFKNLPVRKNYFKSGNRGKEDLKKTERLVWSYALIRPELRISLNHNGEPMVLKPSTTTLVKSAQQCFEYDMELVQYEEQNISIDLIFPKKNQLEKSLKSSNDKSFYYVNSRPVQIKSLDKIIKSIFDGKFPTCCIAFTVSNDDVDVNLEPNKSSVMFKKQEVILHFVESKLKETYKNEEDLDESTQEIPQVLKLKEVFKERDLQLENQSFEEKQPKIVKDSGDVPKVTSWSKGQLQGSSENLVQPVTLLSRPKPAKKRDCEDMLDVSEEYFETMKKQMLMTSFTGNPQDFNIPSPKQSLPKKPKMTAEIPRNQSLIEDSFIKRTPKKVEDSRKSILVRFDKDKTNDVFKETEEVIEIVGQVKHPENEFWVVQIEGKLLLLNHFRAQEVILYKKLMQTHAVTSMPIPKGPIDIRQDHRWDPTLEASLMQYKSDPRILKNGLKIQVTDDENIFLTEVSPKIPIFGVFDLIEILRILKAKPNARLEESRPMKVIAFFKSEVKRMIRSTPNPDQTILKGLMDFVKQEKIDTCIHSQSLFHILFED